MGKLEDNKKKKKRAIINSAFSLFIHNGINDTSIADIMKKAELAKGTFYLYFKDKFEVRDFLIREKAAQIFDKARIALEHSEAETFDEKVILMVDNILNQLNDDQKILKFIAKNLSWGIFRNAMATIPADNGISAVDFIEQMFHETNKKFRNPEMLIFMIVELVNSTAYNVILYHQPVELPELKRELYPFIRKMIHDFEIEETSS